VLFTRGQGCGWIADLVSDGSAARVDGDLAAACIAHQANVLVTAKASSFDLANSLVLYSIDEATPPPAVVGAVGTGPHSPLVAETTARIAAGLGADALLVTMATDESDEDAKQVLKEMALRAPEAAGQLIVADSTAAFVAALPPDGLLVLGAPGGSWWQRQFFGAGRRLLHAAPAGAIVVKAVDRRCFHGLLPLTAFSPLMGASDAAAVMDGAVAPVVDDRKIVGLVRRSATEGAPAGTKLADVMENPVFALADDRVADIAELVSHFDGAPIPVVDQGGHLLGGIAP
jgi:CBS domain-containing protein